MMKKLPFGFLAGLSGVTAAILFYREIEQETYPYWWVIFGALALVFSSLSYYFKEVGIGQKFAKVPIILVTALILLVIFVLFMFGGRSY